MILLLSVLLDACSVAGGQPLTPELTSGGGDSPLVVVVATVTATLTPTATATFTATPTQTSTPTITPTPTVTATPTVTSTPTATSTVTPTPMRTAIPKRAGQPDVAARAAAVLDLSTGAFLYSKNATARVPMASLTKMMTALLAVERGSLDQMVNVTVDSRTYVDSSLMGLLPGERLSLLDLLYGLLLPSGNDAADQIARTIGGSEQAFVGLMNDRAKQLGLNDTHYANPHGLDDPNHYSSAVDLARLASVALQNPTFAKIVQTSARTVRGVRTYQLKNTNKLLPRDDVFGVKTGNTDAAGRCTVVLFRRQGRDMIVVVLNSVDRDGVALRLANYAYSLPARTQLDGPPLALLGRDGTNPSVPASGYLTGP